MPLEYISIMNTEYNRSDVLCKYRGITLDISVAKLDWLLKYRTAAGPDLYAAQSSAKMICTHRGETF